MDHLGRPVSAQGTAGAVDDVFPQECLETESGILSYRQCGQGHDTVVLMHGISSGAASWLECAQALQPRCRVIAWNAPGYGLSSGLSAVAPTALHYAEQLSVLLTHLQVDRCLVVGHSLGALMAAAYASLAQCRASAFVLLSPALGYQFAGKAHLADTVRASRFKALEDKGLQVMARELPKRLLAPTATFEHQARITENALQLNEAGYRQAVEMLCSEDINRYPLSTDRAQVFCGEFDVVTPAQQSAAYAAGQGLEFGLVNNAGHACYVEQPGQVAAIIHAALLRANDRV